MTRILPPGVRPADARFSSGPTRKRPGWTLKALEGALLGRSHRSKPGKAKLKRAIDLTREILAVGLERLLGLTVELLGLLLEMVVVGRRPPVAHAAL